MTYDAAGNITNDGVHTYTYDAENRIVAVDTSGATATYQYDAFGHRIATTVGSTPHELLYDASGKMFASMLVTPTRMWERGELYAGNWHLATYSWSTTFFNHADWLGTVRVKTDPSGAQANESFTSLPFGDCLTWTGNTPCHGDVAASASHFTDQDRDAESGLDHFLFRQYSSIQGRWMTPDPAGLAAVDPSNPQSWNAYAYVANDPIDAVDPLGLMEDQYPSGTIKNSGDFWSTLRDFGSIGVTSNFFACPECLLSSNPWGKMDTSFGVGSLIRFTLGGASLVSGPQGVEGGAGIPSSPQRGVTNAVCSANQRRFFNWLDNSTIRGMATDLRTTPTIIFTLAAKEGGWTQGDLDHNIPLNNPFGRNRMNSKGQAAGNLAFPDLQAAVTDWEKHILAAPYVQGITDPARFVDALLEHGYNANKVPYRAAFISIAGSMPGHMSACGVKR